MAKAVGIGGVFLHFEDDEKEVMDWYEEHLAEYIKKPLIFKEIQCMS